MNSHQTPQEGVALVAVKPPPFWRANPTLWFTQMESQFLLARITTESTKFHHVVAALQPEELAVVGDIILNPPADNPYSKLRDRLCAQYAESQEQQLQDLISGMQLGDRRPSRLLLEMRAKAGSRIGDDLLKSLFLQRLPTQVRQILAISSDKLDKLAEMADEIVAASTSSSSIQSVKEDCDFQAPLMEISARLSRLEARRDRPRSRSRNRSFHRDQRWRSPSRDQQDSGLCWYHFTFKQRANKCKQPCSFRSEN